MVHHDIDSIGSEWVKVTNDNYNEFCIIGYNYFRRLRMAGILNPMPNSKIFPFKPYYSIDNIKRPIKLNTGPYRFDMVTPLCHDNNKVI